MSKTPKSGTQKQGSGKTTTVQEAITKFEQSKPGCVAAQAEKVDLWGQCPPIVKMDGSLAALTACRQLSLSSNNIDKLGGLAGLQQLIVLSLGRNQLKKLEGLEPVADTLQQLWVSYNLLDKLAGVEKAVNLRVLYASNNCIKDWGEVDTLGALEHLQELLLTGNPLCTEHKEAGTLPQYRTEVLRRLPRLKKLDGVLVEEEEREAAIAAGKPVRAGQTLLRK